MVGMGTVVATVERQTQGAFGGPDPAAERSPLPRMVVSVTAHVVAALILIWPAFWNGFPLVFADTGTYLGQALLHYLGWDRPPFYSFFLLATDWQQSLWLPALAQGLLVAHLLGLVLRSFDRPEPLAVPVAAAALSVLTSLPWLVAQLIPDVFTGVTVLTIWLLGFRLQHFSRLERVYLFTLTFLAVVVHQSHLPLAFGLALVGGLLLATQRGWRQALRPTLRMLAPAMLAALALVAVNEVGRGKLSLSPYGAVFLATRMLYDGPAMTVAQRECPKVGWKLCDVLDRLPDGHNDFLWGDDSPLRTELGGAANWAPEATAVVAETMRQEPVALLSAALRNTLTELTLAGVGDGLEPWPPPQGPVPIVARFFPHELAALQSSRQQTGHLVDDAELFLPLHLTVMLAAVSVLLWLLVFRWPRLPLHAIALAVMVLAGTLANAVITSALSGPAARYQARIVWVLPFTSAVILTRLRLVPQHASISLRPRFPG
jgi:hypothetical protein